MTMIVVSKPLVPFFKGSVDSSIYFNKIAIKIPEMINDFLMLNFLGSKRHFFADFSSSIEIYLYLIYCARCRLTLKVSTRALRIPEN